jgi:hypothetical protein
MQHGRTNDWDEENLCMPTLFRFLVICAVIAGSVYGAMWALVLFVDPQPRDVTIRIPAERVNPPATGSIRP